LFVVAHLISVAQGPLGTIGHYPEHAMAPPPEKKDPQGASHLFFRPPGGGHVTLPTRSIMEATLSRTPRALVAAQAPESVLLEMRARRL
jgi:hypothetical protein